MSSERGPVVVLEYGMGNVLSVQSAFAELGCQTVASDEKRVIGGARALVIPGVGAFGQAMDNLRARDLVATLHEFALAQRKPVLGICLGMQLFADSSEEMGHHVGLGWIPGTVRLIDAERRNLSLPHVGWNNVAHAAATPLFRRIPDGAHFYFDHSFEYTCEHRYVVGTAEYGAPVIAAVGHGRITGVQFHPEKSQTTGLKLLRNFLNAVDAHRGLTEELASC